MTFLPKYNILNDEANSKISGALVHISSLTSKGVMCKCFRETNGLAYNGYLTLNGFISSEPGTIKPNRF